MVALKTQYILSGCLLPSLSVCLSVCRLPICVSVLCSYVDDFRWTFVTVIIMMKIILVDDDVIIRRNSNR